MLRNLLLLGLVSLLTLACSRQDALEFQRGEQAQQAGNHAEAYWHWRPLADQGHADAQYRIGWMYANGQGLVLDEGQAMDWWRRAAQQRHADASFSLAMAYYLGEGVPRDPETAVQWLSKAVRLGVEDAGEMLLTLAGTGVDAAQRLVRDRLKGEHWRAWGGVRRVKAERANVRAGMGTEHALVTALEQGAEVLALHQEQGWVRIGIPGSGELAWIYAPLLEQ